jgi:hypothetical protein
VDFKELIEFKWLKFGLTSFTVFLALILGVVTWSSLFPDKPRSERGVAERKSLIQVERGLASIQNSQDSEFVGEASEQTIEVSCIKDEVLPPIGTLAKNLRIKITGCTPELVFNERNGFEATLFTMPDGTFSTDYISLAEGENLIRLEGVGPKGEAITVELTAVFD